MRRYDPYSEEAQNGISLRHVVDLIVCLAVTVLCVRTFVVEGYMISTGSMAPNLLGYHKRVVCPLCQTPFELGVAFDQEEGFVSASPNDPTQCRCPNCGADNIDVRSVPKTQGDQLLVHKNAYLFRQPDRWEVVVFRNPALATEAYVKRVIAKPGESIRIMGGDVFINGDRARKNMAQCRATQVTVYDDSRRPTDANWQSRWTIGSAWQQSETGFRCTKEADWSWVRYGHWLRSGGNHRTSTKVPPKQLAAARRKFSTGADGFPFVPDRAVAVHTEQGSHPVEFDEDRSMLTTKGVMTDELRKQLLSTSSDQTFRSAVEELAKNSHLAPIQDNYGYNTTRRSQAVNDVGVSLTLTTDDRSGQFVIQLATPKGPYEVILDCETGSAQLFGHDEETISRTGTFAPSQLSTGVRICVRQTDRQVMVTFNDENLFEPLLLADDPGSDLGHQPVSFAARGANVVVSGVLIIRDIHYTEGRGRNAINEDFTLGAEEYFVLGDNSPVSHDSRNWADAAVHKSDLIGKPVIVHLPSSPKAIRLGSDSYLIRLPEFSKIRYIR